MKIEMTCRCGFKASWEDEDDAAVRRCARAFADEHGKCAAVVPIIQHAAMNPGFAHAFAPNEIGAR